MTPTNPYNSREFRLVVEALQLCNRLERWQINTHYEGDYALSYSLSRAVAKARERWLRRQGKLLQQWKEVA